jgi:ubiquitin C-terminal hydrolase
LVAIAIIHQALPESAHSPASLKNMPACPHIARLVTPDGVKRLSLAAESVFASSGRPFVGGKSSALVPRCVEPHCPHPSTGNIHICVECVYLACNPQLPSDADDADDDDDDDDDAMRNNAVPAARQLTHLGLHDAAASHPISLSIDHGRLYCYRCDDYVYEPFLGAAVELQHRIAISHRRNFLSSASPLDRQDPSMRKHPLVRDRSKRRRVASADHWTPTEHELSVISSKSFARPATLLSSTPPVGLYNLGNSCYMNSVLQAFLNAPPLRGFFLADGHRPYCTRSPKSDCLACAMDKLVCDSHAGEIVSDVSSGVCRDNGSSKTGVVGGDLTVESGSCPFLVPQRILEIMWKHAEHLASYAQHDAHEFLIATLNVLNAHCRVQSTPSTLLAPSVEAGASASRPSSLTEDKLEKRDKHNRRDKRGTRESTRDSRDKNDKRRVDLALPPQPVPAGPISPIGNLRVSDGVFTDTEAPMGQATYEPSIVHNLFSGTLQSDVICRVCGNSSPTLEKFYDISLDVDNVAKPRASAEGTPGGGSSRAPSLDGTADGDAFTIGGGSSAPSPSGGGDLETANTLVECLARFTEPEMLGESAKMYCAVCGVRQEAMKQMSIRALPPVLCLHFKRFEQSFAKIRRAEMVKVDTAVEFPVDALDLSPFQTASGGVGICTTGATANGASSDGLARAGSDAVYDLFAVVNHVGKIDRGHYTTLVRRRGRWFKCDDEKVTPALGVGTVIRSGEAYLAFYVQRHPNYQY